MLTIRKNIGVMALVLGFGALGAAPALAQAKATTKYSSTFQSVPLSTANGYPNPGGSAVLVGTAKTKPLGAAAVIDRVRITGLPEPGVFALKGTERIFFADGTASDTFTGTATLQADGSQKVVAKGRVTGGTGRYRSASGHFTFTGTVASGSTVLSGRGSGKISY